MSEEQATPETVPEEMVYVDVPSEIEIIGACFNALSAIDGFDPMKKGEKEMKQRIISRCIKMLDVATESLYEFVIDKNTEDAE